MTNSTYSMIDYTLCNSSLNISMANGTTSPALGMTTICISKLINFVLHVPGLQHNLLSVSWITKDMNCNVIFYPSYCVFQDQTSRRMIGNAKVLDNLYCLAKDFPNSSSNKVVLSVTTNAKVLLWNKHLGHSIFPYLKSLYLDIFSNKEQILSCEQCTLAKQPRSHHPIQLYKPSKPFHLIHSDIWGPSKCPNITSSKWFITFINDHFRACWVYLMREKSKIGNVLKRFHKFIMNMFQTSIKILQTDNGQEYFSNEFIHYLVEQGIIHQSSFLYNPQ